MGWVIGLGNGIPFRMGSSMSWSSYWLTLISATVEDANPDEIVLIFPTAQPTLTDTDFTVTVNGGAVAVSSASWAGAVLTLVLASNVVCGDTVVVTFIRTGDTANVTNNVGSAELKLYITGLATSLSSGQRLLLDTFVKSIHTGLGITHLDQAFDVMYILAGETQESSLKNLVKNAHHATNVNAATFVALEGFTGDGATSYLDSNYNPATEGSKYTLNDASHSAYIRTERDALEYDYGAFDSVNAYRTRICSRYSTKLYAVINNGTQDFVNNSSSMGLTIICRTANNAWQGYQNNILIINSNGVSTGIPSLNIFLLGRNADGVLSIPSIRQMSFFFYGKSFDNTKRQAIQDAIESYMDANGKGVIA